MITLNPDNFLFHSRFWYPTDYKHGSLPLTNVDIPDSFTLSDQYNLGDYYIGLLDYTDSRIIGERFRSDSVAFRTKGNELICIKGAQSIGEKMTAIIHWRIYPKPTEFNFISRNRLEESALTITGSITLNGSDNYRIPSGLSGKHFARGIYRKAGDKWRVIGGSPDVNYNIYVHYDYSSNEVVISPSGGNNGDVIEYKIQIVPLDPPQSFIFNSKKFSFCIPDSTIATIEDPGSTVEAGDKIILTGDWIQLPGTTTSYDVKYRWRENTDYDTQGYYDNWQFPASPNDVLVTPSIESDNNGRIRPRIEVENFYGTSQTYTAKNVDFYIYLYQNNAYI